MKIRRIGVFSGFLLWSVSLMTHAAGIPVPPPPFVAEGHDVSLVRAVGLISPVGYSLKGDYADSKKEKVSWSGGKGQSWISVLAETVAPLGFDVKVDEKNKTVSLMKKQPSARLVEDEEVAVREKVALPEQKIVVSEEEWVMESSDGYVSSALSKWGKKAGFDVFWEPKDFRIATTRTVFKGTFRKAVSEVVESLSITDNPVKAIFYPNNVVRIVRFDGQTSELLSTEKDEQ